jgi:tripartite ATP-independent transporter DctP family solute receptor
MERVPASEVGSNTHVRIFHPILQVIGTQTALHDHDTGDIMHTSNVTSDFRRTLVKLGATAILGASMIAPHVVHAEIREHKIKFAYVTAADTGRLNGVDKFVELVKQKSAGKIDIKVYPGGSLGGDVQMISAMQGGTLEMGVMGTNALVGVVRDFSLLDFPYLFDNEKEASDLIDGPVGKDLFGKLAAKGLIGMPISAYGFRHLHNSKRPVNKLEDINGLKLRVIQSPVYVDFVKGLGGNPVPMSFTEVYTAMEQKAIDGMTNTGLIASSMKSYEVQKYMSLTRHMYNYIVLLVGRKTWDKFNDEEKALITQAADEAKQYQRKLLVDVTAQSLADLTKHGMVINEVAPAEIARMRAAGQPVVDKYAGELSPGLLQKTNDALKAMRK